MRPFYTLIIVFLLAPNLYAQEIDWVVAEQSVHDEAGTAITSDKHGHIYQAGDLGGAITFGEGATPAVVGNYVASYQADGAFNWVANIVSDGSPLLINGIDVDNAGNVYIAGRMPFGSNHTFGPGEPAETTVSTNGNSSDAFVARFTKKGRFKWVRQGGLGEDNGANGIAVAGNGDNYITGFYRAHIIFGEEGNTPAVDLFAEGGELDNDIFIVKFDKQGDLVWAKSAGGAVGADTGFDIRLDGNKALYVGGHFIDNAIFGKATPEEITISSDGSFDGYIVRYTSAGDPEWALPIGGSGSEQARSVAAADGRVLVVGSFTADFNLNSTDGATQPVPVVLADNFFLASYDEDGVLDGAGAIYLDDLPDFYIEGAFGQNGQACVLGNFSGNGIFGIGQDGITVLNAPGDPDMFFACYKDNGILQWAVSDPARLNAGTLNGDGDIVVTGGFQGTTVFGPGDPNETTIDSDGFDDIFLAKYTNQTPALGFARSKEMAKGGGDRPVALTGVAELIGSYPNPFNPQTTIRVSLQEAAAVSLVVYDALGREVATLVRGTLDAGVHDVAFDAGDLPGGLYLYRLTSPAGNQTRTMLLLK